VLFVVIHEHVVTPNYPLTLSTNMTGTDRLSSEQVFHDQQAAQRAERFRIGQARLSFTDDAFLDHETWIRPAFCRLGPLAGKRALDYGCGHGMAAVVMARAGAIAAAFDLSPGYVKEVQDRALANGVRVECVVGDGEKLPFLDDSYDVVWGNAVLHHLDLARAGRELHRILKPGGIAVFCEPWGGNPFLSFARDRLPYPGKQRTPDERPLTSRDLNPLRAIFPVVELEGFQLLGMVRRVLRSGRICRFLDGLDASLLGLIPSLSHWCRYAVITIHKET
jgi:SAM-dependent methyltransferase